MSALSSAGSLLENKIGPIKSQTLSIFTMQGHGPSDLLELAPWSPTGWT